jgi:group I intron endonuclease
VEFIVYKAVSTVTGKVYVGITRQGLEKRIISHQWAVNGRSSVPFHSSWRKHGRASFQFSVIDIASNWAELQTKEREWINRLNCKSPHGYNLTDGGDGASGMAPESIERMAASKRGTKATVETRAKMSAAQLRRTWTPEQLARHSDMCRGRMAGKRLSQETKQKNSDAQRGTKRGPRTEETKRKISVAHKGKTLSDAHRVIAIKTLALNRDAARAASIGRIVSTETRKRLSESHKGIRPSEETKRKRSESVRLAHARLGNKWNNRVMELDSKGRFVRAI